MSLSKIVKCISQPPNKRDKLPERGIFLLRGHPRPLLLQPSHPGGEIAARPIRPYGQEASLLCKVDAGSENHFDCSFVHIFLLQYT